MKHLAKIAGGLIAMLLLFGSVQAWAAGATQDREFNHMSTGFPLVGVHATTACEACHVGGVFVGTPRACDGCHATGKRIVATPKSTKHIVTDAPCETCHFNTSTFFGARYNHGTAVPGQCENCHNGRITQGKPTSHPVTIYPCDNCHRSSSWLPASWNHRDTVSDCSTCHKAGGPGRNYGAGHLPMSMGATPTVVFTANCRACHTNYYTFLSAFYNHSGAGTACQECHGGSLAGAAIVTGVLSAKTTGVQAVHLAVNGGAPFATATCQSCHLGYATFLGARYNHSGAAATGCPTCHVSPASTYNGYLQVAAASPTVGTVHAVAVKASVGIILPGTTISTTSTGCDSCHATTNTSTWLGARYNHADAAYSTNCQKCHVAGNAPLRVVPSSHSGALPALGNPGCLSCHGTSVWGTRMNHAIIGAVPCKQCHDSGLNTGSYFTGMEKKADSHKGYSQATQDCISCHIRQYNRWNDPN